MDTQRLIAIAGFCMISLMLWQSWFVQTNPEKYSKAAGADISQKIQNKNGQITEKVNDLPNVPKSDSVINNEKPAVNSIPQFSSKRVHVTTDLFEIEIDTQGADIKKASLLQYPIDVNNNKNPIIIMDQNADTYLISQSGLLNKDNKKIYAPDHNTNYLIEKYEYNMGEQNQLEVVFKWLSEDNKMEIKKTYLFTKDNYAIKIIQEITNHSDKVINGYAYRQLQRNNPERKSVLIQTYTGGMLFRDGGGFEKYSFGDMEDEVLNRKMKSGWAAMIEHYFLAAWIPAAEQTQHYYSQIVNTANNDKRYIIGLTSAAFNIEPNKTINLTDQLFIGPKLQTKLSKIATNLDDTVDYGFLCSFSLNLSRLWWSNENLSRLWWSNEDYSFYS